MQKLLAQEERLREIRSLLADQSGGARGKATPGGGLMLDPTPRRESVGDGSAPPHTARPSDGGHGPHHGPASTSSSMEKAASSTMGLLSPHSTGRLPAER